METAKTVLIIEDDRGTRHLLHSILTAEGLRVLEAEGAKVGITLLRKEKPDLVVLDLSLPDGTGFDVCKEIRSHKTLAATPVIMLTGRSELEDKVSGFEAGADQYLVKPVHPAEFRQWVRALLRRLSLDQGQSDELLADDLVIDLKAHTVRFRDQLIPDLSVKQFELLCFLVKKRPQVLSRKYILSCLWRTVAMDHLVDAHLTNLRKKLPPELSDRIQNIPGKGFRYLA
ncbi:MAG: response regulator transcription factor [Elusimicrobiota bacterium]